ncbi:hypothetical protein IFR05_004664 [Cadophora sp. M221]|nr:hypothetical protein IFR05_004664 [Cadophora sp. M221]
MPRRAVPQSSSGAVILKLPKEGSWSTNRLQDAKVLGLPSRSTPLPLLYETYNPTTPGLPPRVEPPKVFSSKVTQLQLNILSTPLTPLLDQIPASKPIRSRHMGP